MRDFLAPHFQPIVDRHGDLHSYEAFIRLRQDSSGTARFVPRWERSRLIAVADLAMIDHLGAVASQPRYRGQLRFHINISTVTIDANPHKLATSLGKIRPFTQALTVEIGHLAVQHNYERLLELTHLLRHRSITVALEDARLETAFTSRRFLETIRPEFIKLDSQYILELVDTPAYAALINVVATASEVGTHCIVKNIDSADGLKLAVLSGARYLQGRMICPESATVPAPQGNMHIGIANRHGLDAQPHGRLTRVLAPTRRALADESDVPETA